MTRRAFGTYVAVKVAFVHGTDAGRAGDQLSKCQSSLSAKAGVSGNGASGVAVTATVEAPPRVKVPHGPRS